MSKPQLKPQNKLPNLHFCFQQQENVYRLYLYDDVEEYGEFNWETWTREESETSAKHFRDTLDQIPDTAEIELYINSNGGSVKEGIAIYNLLKRHPAHKTGYVDGVAHSIAFVIFQACDHRIMGEGTSALIHEIWACVCGNAEELRKEAENLDKLMEANRKLFMQRAKNITEEELKEKMKGETQLTPDDALNYGFCDEIANRGTVVVIEDGMKQAQRIQALRQQFKGNENFENELEEFEKLTKPKQSTEQKEQRESTDMMSAFFNAFK